MMNDALDLKEINSNNERNPDEGKHHKEESATSPAPTQAQARQLDWFGAPRCLDATRSCASREFRDRVRRGLFNGPTNAQCPGYLQCNLVVLPQAYAFDFLLFCQRNPQACPLLEVCDVGSPHPVGLTIDGDVRTDCPM